MLNSYAPETQVYVKTLCTLNTGFYWEGMIYLNPIIPTHPRATILIQAKGSVFLLRSANYSCKNKHLRRRKRKTSPRSLFENFE